MANLYLGLGTNLGNKKQNIETAVRKINDKIGKVVSLSSFYETEPWGFESENAFINAAVFVKTEYSPEETLAILKKIEKEMGRTSKSVGHIYSDRIIDIDILMYDDLVINTEELTVPHPLMLDRDFVMKPLIEISGDVIHPILKKRLKDLLK